MQRTRVGAFELDHPLGEGGMGQVWAGHHVESGLPVAVKLVGELSDRLRAVFRREVEAVAALEHPGIVMVHDHGEISAEVATATGGQLTAGAPWLVMEHASGGTLEQQPVPDTWTEARALLLSILDGLAHAHARGVVHRDLKPANVLVCSGADLRPGLKLADFGLALALDGRKVHAAAAGTPAWMAPEQVLGHWWDLGPWTDLYALGGIAWQLVTGRRIYPGEDGKRVGRMHVSQPLPAFEPRIGVPPELEGWLRALLEKQPERRPDSAAWCAAELLTMGPVDDTVTDPGPRGDAPTLHTLVPPTQLTNSTIQLTDMGDELLPPTPTEPSLPPLPLARRRRLLQPPAEYKVAEPVRPWGLTEAGLGLFSVRPAPFTGRTTERGRLWKWLRTTVRTNSAQVAVLRGQAGVGASRLAEWVGQRAVEVGAARLLTVPHGPEAGTKAGLVALAEEVVRLRGLPDAVASARAWRLGIEPEALLALSRGEPVDRGTDLGLRLVSRVAEDGPVILVLDDAHLDEWALGLANAILEAAALRDLPVLVLLTVDEDALDQLPSAGRLLDRLLERDGVHEVVVRPLRATVMARLVRRLLPLDPATEARVVSVADGSPLVAIQLVGSWVHSGQIRSTEHGFAPAGRLVAPEDLASLWTARLAPIVDTWSEAEAQSVQMAAVLGATVDGEEWSRACDHLLLPASDAALDDLVRAGLVRRRPGGFRFTHGLVRMALRQRAREEGRLEALEQSAAAVIGAEEDERIGRHLLAAGRPLEAFPHLLTALNRRLDQDAHGAALWLFEQAATALERADIPRADPRWGQILVLRVAVLLSDWRLEDTVHEARRGEILARRHQWPDTLQAMVFYQATASFRLHRLDDATDQFNRALSMAEEGTRPRARALRGLGQVAQARGDYALAERYYLAYEPIAVASGDPFLLASAHNDIGNAAARMGHTDEALERFEKGLALCEEHGFKDLVIARCNVIGQLISRGEHARAHDQVLHTLDESEEAMSALAMTACHVLALRTSAETGDWTTWAGVVPRLRTLFAASRVVDASVAETLEHAADAALARGLPIRARFPLELARDQLESLGDQAGVRRIDTRLADLGPSIGA